MSYARFGEDGSDVFVYASGLGGIVCCQCSLSDLATVRLATTDEMLRHLAAHRHAGDTVPRGVTEALEADRESNDDYPMR